MGLFAPTAGPTTPREGRTASGRRTGPSGAFTLAFTGSGRSIAQVSRSITTTLPMHQAVSRVGRETRESPIPAGGQAARSLKDRRSGTSPVRGRPRPAASGLMTGPPTVQGRPVMRVRSSGAPGREVKRAPPFARKSCPAFSPGKSQRPRRGGRPKVSGSKALCPRVRPFTHGAGTPARRPGR